MMNTSKAIIQRKTMTKFCRIFVAPRHDQIDFCSVAMLTFTLGEVPGAKSEEVYNRDGYEIGYSSLLNVTKYQ